MRRADSFGRGIVLGPLLAPEDEASFKREQSSRLDEAARLGATDLQLLVLWRQADERALEVFPYDSLHDDLLTWVVEQAKRRKLRVWLAPALGIEDGERTRPIRQLRPSSWERWWWSYRRFALHYARFAATRKIPMLAVGSALRGSEDQAARWRALIADVRKIYKGKLTYVASSDAFEQVGFWDALDTIGLQLGQDASPPEEPAALAKQLAASKPARERGYFLSEGSGADGVERVRARQRALFESFRDDASLQGVYLISPLGDADPRAASEVVRHWYRKSKS